MWQRSAATPTQVNSPAWVGGEGNLWGERPARVMKSSPLLTFFFYFPPVRSRENAELTVTR